MEIMEYIIVGDTEKFKDCLITVAGKNRDHAEDVLHRMLNNPTDNDKALSKGHFNLRIEEVSNDSAWWNDPFLAN